MNKKDVVSCIKLMIEAGKAMPGPKIASVLAPKRVAMPKFCKDFNDVTSESGKPYQIGEIVTARIAIRGDGSYDMTVVDTPVSILLKKAAAIQKGSQNPGKEIAFKIKKSTVCAIAERKMDSMNADSLEKATNMVMGTAKSMGFEIIEDMES